MNNRIRRDWSIGTHTRRSGFLLLTVMVVLVIAGMVLANLALRSMQLARLAGERQTELQVRWGVVSVHEATLPAAAAIFSQLELETERQRDSARQRLRTSDPAPNTIDQTIGLGQVQFSVRIADEDAKVNLNTVYHYRGESQANRYLMGVLPGGGPTAIRLRPTADSLNLLERELDEEGEEDEVRPAAFRSWGHVFDLESTRQFTPSAWLISASSGTTCWGSGSVNIARAADRTIAQVGELVVSKGRMQRLITDYRRNPSQSVEQLIDQLGLDQREQFFLQDLLTKQSSCYSLWITAQSNAGQWQQLSISEQFEDGSAKAQSFVF